MPILLLLFMPSETRGYSKITNTWSIVSLRGLDSYVSGRPMHRFIMQLLLLPIRLVFLELVVRVRVLDAIQLFNSVTFEFCFSTLVKVELQLGKIFIGLDL